MFANKSSTLWSSFFMIQNCLFFVGIIFCFNVVQVRTFSTRGVHIFITKKREIPINLFPFFNGVLFLFCRFLQSGVTSFFLLKSKKVSVTQNKTKCCFGKTLVWSAYVWRTATATCFFRKIVLYELGNYFNKIPFM